MTDAPLPSTWTPQSWRAHPVGQPVVYPQPSPTADLKSSDEADLARLEDGKQVEGRGGPDPVLWKRKQPLEEVVKKLEKLPPIVSAVEVRYYSLSFPTSCRGVRRRLGNVEGELLEASG